MKRKIFFAIIFFIIPFIAYAQVDDQDEKLFQEKQAEGIWVTDKKLDMRAKGEDTIYGHFYHEESTVKQGGRCGQWQITTFRVALLNKGLQFPYFEATRHNRFGERDYNFDFGGYFKLAEGYARIEAGFGHDVSYTSKFRAAGEIEQKLLGTLFVNINAEYQRKPGAKVYIVSPGLIYYFGDHYIFLDYGLSIIESRGAANYGIAKANIRLMKNISFIGGFAIGERLYDIYGLDKASSEKGYIVFGGLEIKMNDDVAVRLGGSYSEEEPSFIKRSFEVLVKASF
ncbi:MAG: YaiO family outer membrane beta-barrel protein [Candidatus Omnitrophica bacterium]|nr:YaiO family outer membrane beta-barrel protein [Candidatus Omnitrophota bacterium]